MKNGMDMQNDLISKSELLESLNDWIDENTDINTIIRWIEEYEVSYNAEQVLAELEDEYIECPNCSMYCADANMCGFDEMRKQAIDIVRNGGRE